MKYQAPIHFIKEKLRNQKHKQLVAENQALLHWQGASGLRSLPGTPPIQSLPQSMRAQHRSLLLTRRVYLNPKVLPIYIPGFSELIVLPRLLPWGRLSVLDKGEENKAVCFLTDSRQEKHGWVRISTGPRLKELMWLKGN